MDSDTGTHNSESKAVGSFFCGICGYTQGNSTSSSHPSSASIRCSRCLLMAHTSCLRIANNNERLPPPEGCTSGEGAWVFTCTCCRAKVEECDLSRNASVFNNKVDRHYACLFCDPNVVNSCPKKKQIHMKRVQCGLWAHTICHLLGNGTRSSGDGDDTTGQDPGSQEEENEVLITDTRYDNWDVDMIVLIERGENTGRYAVIAKRPFFSSTCKLGVELRLRESSSSGRSSDDNTIFFLDCTHLRLAEPIEKDSVVVHSGPHKGLVGRLKELQDQFPIETSQAAWLYTRPSSSSSSSSSRSRNSRSSSNSRNVHSSSSSSSNSSSISSSGNSSSSSGTEDMTALNARLQCLVCHKGGAALVRCGEPGCQQRFHVTCALGDRRCTVQAQQVDGAGSDTAPPAHDSNDDDADSADDNNVQLWQFCPSHKKPFEPSAHQMIAPTTATAATTDDFATQRDGGGGGGGGGDMAAVEDGSGGVQDMEIEDMQQQEQEQEQEMDVASLDDCNDRPPPDQESELKEGQEEEEEEEEEQEVVAPPQPTTFAAGMDPGECTVLVEWRVANMFADRYSRQLAEPDLRDLFALCGHIFRVEIMGVDRDQLSGSAKIYFSESNGARRAVRKFSKYSHEPQSSSSSGSSSDSSTLRDQHFSLEASHLGAQIYVGGLDPGVTKVKMRQVFRDSLDIDLLENKCIAFVKYLKLSTAVEAVKHWDKKRKQGVSSPKGVLAVSLKAGRSRVSQSSRSSAAASASDSSAPFSFTIDRSGDIERDRDRDRDSQREWSFSSLPPEGVQQEQQQLSDFTAGNSVITNTLNSPPVSFSMKNASKSSTNKRKRQRQRLTTDPLPLTMPPAPPPDTRPFLPHFAPVTTTTTTADAPVITTTTTAAATQSAVHPRPAALPKHFQQQQQQRSRPKKDVTLSLKYLREQNAKKSRGSVVSVSRSIVSSSVAAASSTAAAPLPPASHRTAVSSLQPSSSSSSVSVPTSVPVVLPPAARPPPWPSPSNITVSQQPHSFNSSSSSSSSSNVSSTSTATLIPPAAAANINSLQASAKSSRDPRKRK